MSFAIWYACYRLLQESNKKQESTPVIKQVYVYDNNIKGKKCSINSLRKKFKKGNRGGSCL